MKDPKQNAAQGLASLLQKKKPDSANPALRNKANPLFNTDTNFSGQKNQPLDRAYGLQIYPQGINTAAGQRAFGLSPE